MRTGLVLTVVALTLGCAPRPGRPEGARLDASAARFSEITPLEFRWNDGLWSTTPSLTWEPPGRGDARRLEVRFTVPRGDWVDPTVYLSSCVYLTRAEIAGRVFDEPGPFLAVRDDELGQQMSLTFESTQTIREGGLLIGSQKEVRAAVASAEIGVLWVAFAMVVMAGVLGIAALRGGSEAVLLGLSSLIALSCGLLILQQTTLKADLVPLSLPAMRAMRDVAAFIFPAALCAFFARAVPQRARALHFTSFAMAGALALAVVLQLVGLVALRTSAFYALGGIVAALLLVTGHLFLARKESLVARRLLIGITLALLCATPDLSWGIASVQLLPTSVAHWGLLPLMASLVLVVQDRFRGARDALELRITDIERLNEELRFQVESRSRELRDALSVRPLPAHRTWTTGDVVGERYRLASKLGSGGMADVFAAVRLSDEQRVAVKLLTGDVTRVEQARFAREAEVAAHLRHANLVPVIDVGLDGDGLVYLVMELIDGPNLEQVRTRFGDVAWARRVLTDVTRGLAAVHAASVVHRDLKPSNVLLDGEVARLTDFGVAAPDPQRELVSTVSRRGLSHTGALIGTPRYLAPEVVAGNVATPASDGFALGLLAFELLTGRFPFVDPPFVASLAHRKLERAVPDEALPASLRVLGKLIDPEPQHRPTLSDVLAALERDA